MKHGLLLILSFTISACISGAGERQQTNFTRITQMDWVLGKWESITQKGSLFEAWEKENDSTYSGRSFMIIGKDTVSDERVSLQLRNNTLMYIPIVKNQNQGRATVFKLIETGNDEIIFENKEHDFPQRVIYKNAGPDSLYARIEGNFKGEFHKQEFLMKRSAK